MDEAHTTLAVQQFLDELVAVEGATPAEPIVRALLARSVHRLEMLCRKLLYQNYPRLTKPPVNVEADEVLSAVVERLLKALREARPKDVRQFFALANQHIRWELNDLARRLDKNQRAAPLNEAVVPAPESSGAPLTPDAARMLDEIEKLPEDEREVFSLVRIQGMSQPEVAQLLDISVKTVQRRLNRSVLLLTERLSDLAPSSGQTPSSGSGDTHGG